MWLQIFTRDGTYQELLNNWRKGRLRYIKNYANSLLRGSDEQLNAENIFSIYNDVVLSDGESTHPSSKYVVFNSMCEFTKKDTQLTKWSRVLNYCIECTGVFFLILKLMTRMMRAFHSFNFIMRYIKNYANSLLRGSDEQLNAENIFSIYNDLIPNRR